MLGLLGGIYYLLAVGALYLGVSQQSGFLGQFNLVAALAAALSCAFFGAMCFAADDIRTLLRRIADNSPGGRAVSGGDIATVTPQPLDAPALHEPPAPTDAPCASEVIISDSASSTSDESTSAADAREDQPAPCMEVASAPLSEEEQMAEYDIVHDGVSFLAYGRIRQSSLEAAIAYVKGTRGERD